MEWDDRGLLFVYKSPHEFEAYEKAAEFLRREFGIEMIPYEGAQLTELEPALRPELAGGWHCPTDAHLRPDRLMSALIPVLRARGVEILEDVAVDGFEVPLGKLRGDRQRRQAR